MKCPECGRRGAVLETRPREDNSVWRRYSCSQEHRWKSVERVTQESSGRVRAPRQGAA